MSAHTKMIRSMGKEPLNGLMVENTLVIGAKANNTARAFTSKKAKRDKASGIWGREQNGFEIQIQRVNEELSK